MLVSLALSVEVWLSAVGLGLVALPREVASALLVPGNPAERIGKVVGAVDAGAASQGWWMRTQLASPGTVNLGNITVIWNKANGTNLVGVRLGVLNTTLPIICDGFPHTVLQMDSVVGDYSAKLSKIGAQSDAQAARVSYTCAPDPVTLPDPAGK